MIYWRFGLPGLQLATDGVESVEDICKRFVASAMSLGSLSPEAHQTITAGMNMLGGRSNTGEGGEDPEVYRPRGGRVRRGEGLRKWRAALPCLVSTTLWGHPMVAAVAEMICGTGGAYFAE